jgi:OPA family sugar phosphate sensor protein UhpC-like MFS transporter
MFLRDRIFSIFPGSTPTTTTTPSTRKQTKTINETTTVSTWIKLGHSERANAWIAFFLLYISYVTAYICRKNYSFWLSGIIQRGEMPQTQAAVFGSTMELAYGIGKLAAGPVADNVSPKKLLLISLLIASLCNALMFSTGFYMLDVLLWGLNGFSQAFSWPALALVFFAWFGESPARATLYSVLSTNQNFGSAVTPLILTPFVASSMGWRAALWIPAVIGLSTCVALLLLLKETPDSSSKFSTATTTPTEQQSNSSEKKTETAPTTTTTSTKKQQQQQPTFTQVVIQMLQSPDIWLLGLGYSFLTLVRVGVSDWSLVFLKQHYHLSEEWTRNCLVALEVGGFIGGLAAGFVSDFVFGGKRGWVMVLFSALIAAPGCLIIFSTQNLHPIFIVFAYAMVGLGTFGPHVLVGFLARELFPLAPSTAGSFAKSLAQIGGSLAGVPISLASEKYGWNIVGYVFATSCFIAGVCFLPLLRGGSIHLKKVVKTE